MKAKLYKVKKNKKDQWLQWGQALMSQFKEEALETLAHEGLKHEMFHLFKINGSYYTLGCEIKGLIEPLKENKQFEINDLHNKNKRECLEFVSDTEIVYFF